MPPFRSKKVKALRAGTLRLSKPMGETASTRVPTVAVANTERIFSKTENE
jgi:hypothetical protein